MSENMNPKVYIIILNYNGKSDTIDCLYSLASAKLESASIVVVDNASIDGSVAEIKKEFPKVPIIENKTNLGYAGGNNVGIKFAYDKGADYILLLNNDIKVDPYFLEELLSLALKKPKGGIFGSAIYRYDEPDKIEHLGGFYDSSVCEFVSNKKSFKVPKKVDYVCGCTILIKRDVIKEIGFFEPKFFLLWEEADLCARAMKKGFEIWTQPTSKIWHKISASFEDGKPQTHYFWWRNRLLWIKRNLNKKEKKLAYKKVILPEIIKAYKHFLLKGILLIFSFSGKRKKRKEQYRRLKAGCRGIRDYFMNRFGNTYKKV